MRIDRTLRPALVVAVLLAFLAAPAGAATSGNRSNHYPGQDCKDCHKVRGKQAGKETGKSAPAAAPSGTQSGGTQAAPAQTKGAPSR